MTTVVFTGKGLDPRSGKLRKRDEWGALANAKGYAVTNKVGHGTDFLVASRDDTTKAAAASQLGVRVISYNDFDAMLRGAQLKPGTFNQAPPPPLNTDGMEEIPGWGMF